MGGSDSGFPANNPQLRGILRFSTSSLAETGSDSGFFTGPPRWVRNEQIFVHSIFPAKQTNLAGLFPANTILAVPHIIKIKKCVIPTKHKDGNTPRFAIEELYIGQYL